MSEMHPDLKAAIEAECSAMMRKVGDDLRTKAEMMEKEMEAWDTAHRENTLSAQDIRALLSQTKSNHISIIISETEGGVLCAFAEVVGRKDLPKGFGPVEFFDETYDLGQVFTQALKKACKG